MTEEKPCRHEYVRIYQRKLKGLERRLVATKAWLPVGFKITDFSHLGEGSYCFCSQCRARLYPKRTNAEKAAARLALQASKQAELEGAEEALEELADVSEGAEAETVASPNDIRVEELELEAVELADVTETAVELREEADCRLAGDET